MGQINIRFTLFFNIVWKTYSHGNSRLPYHEGKCVGEGHVWDDAFACTTLDSSHECKEKCKANCNAVSWHPLARQCCGLKKFESFAVTQDTDWRCYIKEGV